jgi:protein SCO1/2
MTRVQPRIRAYLLALLAAFPFHAGTAWADELPGDSVYQVSAQLRDQSGRAMLFADAGGEVRLVSLFYASCGYVCPMLIEQIRAIEAQLDPDQRQHLHVLLISLDPQRDTPEALAKLAKERRLALSRWTLAQPRPADLRKLSAVLGVQYRQLDNGEVNHSSVISLLDAQGRVLAQTTRLGAEADPEFLKAVRAALSAAQPSP